MNALTRTPRKPRLRAFAIVALAASALSAMLIAAPAADAATSSYTYTTWTQPQLYNVRTFSDGPVLTPPTGLPAGATLTTMTGTLNWTSQPAGDVYVAYLCENTAHTACVNISPAAGSYSWNYSVDITSYNIPATQGWHLAVYIDDGSTGNILAALNPSRYLTATGRKAVFNYKY